MRICTIASDCSQVKYSFCSKKRDDSTDGSRFCELLPSPFCDGDHIRRPPGSLGSPAISEMEASVSHLFNKRSIERANMLLLLGIIWGALGVCMVGAFAYDIAFWFGRM